MSEIGFYRYKTIVSGNRTVNFVVNYQIAASKDIVALNECPGFVILKYLDRYGQYRFYAFNKYYRIFDNPSQIGTTNKFITNILTDKSDKQNVGYRNERKIELTAEATDEQLLKLADIYTSPRVYYYIGQNNSDLNSDWIEVQVIANDNVVKRRKQTTGRIDLIVTLPENYTITML